MAIIINVNEFTEDNLNTMGQNNDNYFLTI